LNWVDIIVLAVIAISALSAFLRGFVSEALGIGAWIGAAVASIWGAPGLEANVRQWTGSADIAAPVAYAGVFIVALILLSVGVAMIGGIVRGVGLGMVDSTLGILFGVARGALLVSLVYIGASRLVAVERWPEPVLEARALPYAYQGAVWIADRIPTRYRPGVPAPPAGRETSAAELLRVPAQGRANSPRP
jgi:membrane protein required for colicin V production